MLRLIDCNFKSIFLEFMTKRFFFLVVHVFLTWPSVVDAGERVHSLLVVTILPGSECQG